MYVLLKFLAGTYRKNVGFGVKFVTAKFVMAEVYCMEYDAKSLA
jgi:hypothetical protein